MSLSRLTIEKQRVLPEGMDFRKDHLAEAAMTQPEYMSGVISYAFGAGTNGEGGLLSMLTEGLGNVDYINNDTYQWALHTSNETLIEVVESATNVAKPGLGNTQFHVILENELFNPTDILVTDSGEQVYVLSKQGAGNGVKYTMKLNNPDPRAFLDPSDLQVGARFSKDYSAVAEGSRRGGGSSFGLPMRLQNRMTILRKDYSITRTAATQAVVITFEDTEKPGVMSRLWIRDMEWKHLMAWGQEVERMLMYGRYSDQIQGYVTDEGGSQLPVYQGAGLREQISPAHQRAYTYLTYKQLEDFLLDMSFSNQEYGGATDYLAMTGSMGMIELDRAIGEYMREHNITVTNAGTFITGTGAELTLTGHFKRIEFLNDINLTFKRIKLYDSAFRNRKKHPVSGKPLESYRITIIRTQTADGKPNVVKVSKGGSENLMWYTRGSIGPDSPLTGSGNTGMQMGASGFDGYKVHYLTETSLKLNDPTCCGELIHSMSVY